MLLIVSVHGLVKKAAKSEMKRVHKEENILEAANAVIFGLHSRNR